MKPTCPKCRKSDSTRAIAHYDANTACYKCFDCGITFTRSTRRIPIGKFALIGVVLAIIVLYILWPVPTPDVCAAHVCIQEMTQPRFLSWIGAQ